MIFALWLITGVVAVGLFIWLHRLLASYIALAIHFVVGAIITWPNPLSMLIYGALLALSMRQLWRLLQEGRTDA